ncbi:leucine rich repeat domain-containing protein [Histoplasma capsulatum var. duboisii H88]|uniref:Leucine rich repeat domain-containing protein n=2 Tax=Ajellomyces capsulatus TaxID=5037 RepID=F0UUY8_AJEC8|nr:leucine rich repeat domain-containing protein [Histoplasma capsulatum H143]EGC49715.1 leucine rich repeat domain-containing protein [Histoplasma capsulatum var. duboisii H88]
MVKLNYTGRKVQGLKAGQAVSKDLRKRIPPGLGSRAAARDPHVEIDLTGKELTDEGFAAFIDDLITCIQYRDKQHPDGIVRLTELVLKGNALTVASMRKLGQVVALGSDCLAQLDISDNQISVSFRGERESWQAFLESFQGCYVLRKVDFSNNPLGGAGFDVLARVYAHSDLDFIEPLANRTSQNQADPDAVDALRKAVDVVVLGEEKENRKPPSQAANIEKGHEVHQDSSKAWGSQVDWYGAQPTDNLNYRSTRGLRSVPYLIFSNCCTTNACAFHLWAIILSHRRPDMLLEFLPPGKSVIPAEQTNPVNGIVYTPNEKLSELGRRLLELGNEYRVQESDTDAEETEAQGFDSEFRESDIAKYRELRKKHEIEMERVKNRLLLDIFRTDGPAIADIWSIAFKMMRVARAILLNDGTKLKQSVTLEDKKLMEPCLTNENLTSDDPINQHPKIENPKNGCWNRNPSAQRSESFLEDFPTIQESLEGYSREGLAPTREETLRQDVGNSTSRKIPRSRKDSMAGAKKQPAKAEDKFDIGRFGLPMDIWRRVIADAMGGSELLTVEQQMRVLRYASDWDAIKQELRISGGTEFEQIWKILSSMRCLSYTHH